jgi:molecular chaperone HscB
MQWAVRVNEAYQRLKDPLSRAAYLCQLRGQPVDAERNTAMPAAFLMQQMEWREALEAADTALQVQALDESVARDQAPGRRRARPSSTKATPRRRSSLMKAEKPASEAMNRSPR